MDSEGSPRATASEQAGSGSQAALAKSADLLVSHSPVSDASQDFTMSDDDSDPPARRIEYLENLSDSDSEYSNSGLKDLELESLSVKTYHSDLLEGEATRPRAPIQQDDSSSPEVDDSTRSA